MVQTLSIRHHHFIFCFIERTIFIEFVEPNNKNKKLHRRNRRRDKNKIKKKIRRSLIISSE